MERFTTIPTTAALLLVLSQQMLDGAASYETAFKSPLLTSKRSTLDSANTLVGTQQADADTKNAAYISARNVYYAARDLLAGTKAGMADAANSLRNHIMQAVAEATSGLDADGLAQFEIDTGIALTEPLVFLPPVAVTIISKLSVDYPDVFVNWDPVAATEDGHGAASAYLVEKSADNGTSWDYLQVTIATEVYCSISGLTHLRITPFGDAGPGASVEIPASDFPSD